MILVKHLQDRDYYIEEEQYEPVYGTLNNGVFQALTVTGEFDATVPTWVEKGTCKLGEIEVNGKVIAVPQIPDQFPTPFVITPDGENSIISSEFGIWLVNSDMNILQKISFDSYNRNTMKSLTEDMINHPQVDSVFWNNCLVVSPDSTKLVYSSNKNGLGEKMDWALFVFDLQLNRETMIESSIADNYYANGFLNPNSIFCINPQGLHVAMNFEGQEILLPLLDNTYCIGIQNNLIAYIQNFNLNEICIAQFDGTQTLKSIRMLSMSGEVILRDLNAFSPNNTYCASLITPDNGLTRYIEIFDLKSDAGNIIDTIPDECDTSANIVEFSWIDDKTMLVTISEDLDGGEKLSTWIYRI